VEGFTRNSYKACIVLLDTVYSVAEPPVQQWACQCL